MSEDPDQHPDDRPADGVHDDPIDDRATGGSTDAPGGDGGAGDGDGSDSDDGDGEDAAPSRRVWWIVAAAIALVALVVVLVIALGGGSSKEGDDADPTTTTRDVPTKVLAPEVTEIATAKASLTLIEVFADEPESWSASTEAVRNDDSMVRTGEPGPRATEHLPTIEDPIIGRYAVEDGWEFSNPGPYLPPQPMTFMVVERRDEWAKVLIPARPNHTEGYVRLSDVDITTTENRIEVSLTDTQLTAYDGNEKIAETKVVIGTPFTQTPTGLFYVTDIVPYENPEGVYGPVALATNGYSEWMNEFDTGVPVVALHGTSHPEQVGQAISNGCIRVPNDVITMLAETVPQGTPVIITP